MYFVELNIEPSSPTQTLHDPYSRTNVLYRGQMTQVLNAVNNFNFELLRNHPLYEEKIVPYKSLIRIKDDKNKIIFRGRIIDYSYKMASGGQVIKSFVAECELAYLIDSMQEAEEIPSIELSEYLRRLLSSHNSRVSEDVTSKLIDFANFNYEGVTPIEMQFNNSCNCGPTEEVHHINYGSTFQNIKEQILDRFGGYIWLEYVKDEASGIERRIFNYAFDKFGVNGEMPIELSINLENIKSEYHPSSEITRLIPLGRKLERYELAIERLRHVGIFPNTEVVNYWLNEVQHWRDGKPLPEDQQAISPWVGQLLINLSKLNFKNKCTCPNECNSGGCGVCRNYIDDMIVRLTENPHLPPDVNSRWAYNEAVDFLANAGAIISPEYWKEERLAGIIHVRYLIRIAAEALITDSPRRTNSGSFDNAINWLERDSVIIGDDIEFWKNQTRPSQQTLSIGSLTRTIDGIEVDESISPWIGHLLVNLSRLNIVAPFNANAIRNNISTTINNFQLYEQAIDSLANTGALNSPDYWKNFERARHASLRRLIRTADAFVYRPSPLRRTPHQGFLVAFQNRLIEPPGMLDVGVVHEFQFWLNHSLNEGEQVSPWIGDLLIELSHLNFNSSAADDYRESIRPRNTIPHVNDIGAYEDAIDSLANSGALSSPEYWKDPERRENPNLRMLIRLADLTINQNDPIASFPKPRLTIETVNEGENWLPVNIDSIDNDTIVEGVVVWDEVNDPSELRRKAEEWIENNRSVTNSITVSALDLSHLDNAPYESFRVGNSYSIHNHLLGNSEEKQWYTLIEKRVDVVNPIKSGLTFGDRQIMMSSSR
ncbi:MAG: phage tail protein [Defluviitaleaceae bacterium]|nr:phage tail protein [Defluviitaleaceae bacterium]